MNDEATVAARELLGTSHRRGTRTRVFRIGGGLEIDERDLFELRRRRLFFDEVLMVSHHRERGVSLALAIFSFLMALILGTLGLITGLQAFEFELPPALLLGLLCAAPFLLVLLLRYLTEVVVVTVFGKRCAARMSFWRRREQAVLLYEELVAEIRRVQERLAAAQQEQAPPVTESPG